MIGILQFKEQMLIKNTEKECEDTFSQYFFSYFYFTCRSNRGMIITTTDVVR